MEKEAGFLQSLNHLRWAGIQEEDKVYGEMHHQLLAGMQVKRMKKHYIDVIKNLKPCVSYLVSGSGKPPGPCCSGVKALAAAAATSADKKTACNCIKSTSKSLNINSQLAQALPGNCGVSLPITVSPNADCSK
ncbi:hypothetical protein AHAS_Ahas18G0196200 [Arachis hypogaea]